MTNHTELLERLNEQRDMDDELRDINEAAKVIRALQADLKISKTSSAARLERWKECLTEIAELQEQVKELKASIIRTAKLESERGSFHP